MKIEFISSWFFYLLPLVLLLFIGKKSFLNYKSYFSAEMFEKIFPNRVKKRYSYYFLIISFIALVVALARPVVYDNRAVAKNDKSFIVGIDLSKSMLVKDIYPSRLEFAKNKVYALLKILEGKRVGILGFSSEPFLIAPITNDYRALHFIISHLQTDSINTKGSDIFPLLQQTNIFFKDKSQKVLLILTDGTQKRNFEKSIQYAKKNHIKVFVYGIGTLIGGTIKEKGALLKDIQGNIVVSSLNSTIQTLCKQTGGKYFQYSLQTDDMRNILNSINQIFSKEKLDKEKLKKQKELFYIPLMVAIFCFLMAILGFKRR